MSPRSASYAPASRPGVTGRESGLSIIEVLVATSLSLIVAIAVYDFLATSNRRYAHESELAEAQNSGRVGLDLLANELRVAGFNPRGMPFHALPEGNDRRIRLLSDRNGNGLVGSFGQLDENVAWVFVGPNGEGLYELRRGIDYNGDWSFSGPGESFATVITNVLPIDVNGDAVVEPFLAYDRPPPPAPVGYDIDNQVPHRVTITFGVRSGYRDQLKRSYPVVEFRTDVYLRNIVRFEHE